jgi:hypothetical protein
MNDVSIISFQISVGPCKDILVLSEKIKITLPFIFRYVFCKVYVFLVFRVLRFIVSCMGQELPIFAFLGPLNRSFRSKRFSKLSIPFEIV